MASFPIPPPNPHIIQVCAGVINQYSMEIHHLRTCMNKQSQEIEQQRLEIRSMQDIITQLQDENRHLREAIFEHDKETHDAGAAIRMQHQIVAAQRQLIASLGNDLAQARTEVHQPTTFSSQPTSEPKYTVGGRLVADEQDEGNSTAQDSWQE